VREGRGVRWVCSLAAALIVAGAGPASAAVRIFSYDPVDDTTRKVAGDLTFEFKQRLVFTTVLNIRSTEGRATADLKPVDEHVLGHGGLNRLIGDRAPERDLYEVLPTDQGKELIHAFCPGSTHAWLAFSRMAEARPLRIQVIGDDPAGGPTRLCETLDYAFQGEWKLPTGGQPVKEHDLLEPRHGPF
jgi:hypothetical protein